MRTTEERFWAKVDTTPTIHGCWVWTASKNKKGYGYFGIKGKVKRAHRVAYEMLVGPIPDGLVIDHLCRNPACVRPDHMEPVTAVENTLRGNHTNKGRNMRSKTHCPQGHEYTEENTRFSRQRDGRHAHRICRACQREHDRKRQPRRRPNEIGLA